MKARIEQILFSLIENFEGIMEGLMAPADNGLQAQNS